MVTISTLAYSVRGLNWELHKLSPEPPVPVLLFSSSPSSHPLDYSSTLESSSHCPQMRINHPLVSPSLSNSSFCRSLFDALFDMESISIPTTLPSESKSSITPGATCLVRAISLSPSEK